MARLFFPSARTAPADVLRALRGIDDAAELIWLRRGAWILGTYKPNSERREQARRAIDSLSGPALTQGYTESKRQFEFRRTQHGDKLAMYQLKYQGFVEQKTWEVRRRYAETVAFVFMERWLRVAKWVQQHHYEEFWRAWDRAQEQNEQEEAKIAETRDRSRIREAWRMGFAGRKQFSMTPPKGILTSPFSNAGNKKVTLYDALGGRLPSSRVAVR